MFSYNFSVGGSGVAANSIHIADVTNSTIGVAGVNRPYTIVI